MKSAALEAASSLQCTGWAGAPLRSALALLAWPTALLGGMLAFDVQLPPVALYGFAACFGLAVLVRSMVDTEWALALLIIYMPLSRQYVVPLAPGINGTNMVWLLVVLAWAMQARRRGGNAFVPTAAARPVCWWMALSGLSFVTAFFAEGLDPVLDASPHLRGWADSLLCFFAVSNLIRDGAMARRAVVYMMVGSCIVMVLGLVEWQDKRWYESIEKARLLGPQLQPNDFGAFLVYSAAPFIGVFLTAWQRVRAWPLIVYFLLMSRLLLATFSRGGYIGLCVAFAAAGLVRGKLFLVMVAAVVAGVATLFPEVVPDSLQARVAQSQQEGAGGTGPELDDSAETRLILWHAAIEMTKESPILGKGFGMFPRLKAYYTEVPVRESDNHNMFLFIASQMGVPALLAFSWIIFHIFITGVRLHQGSSDSFGRGIGLGGAALAGAIVGINMFGSRMTDFCVMAYVWVYLAVLTRAWGELAHANTGTSVAQPPRSLRYFCEEEEHR